MCRSPFKWRAIRRPQSTARRPASANAGRLYETFTDQLSGGGTDTNVFVTFSDNGGTGWSTPAEVNDDGGLAAGPTNLFAEVWTDSRPGDLNEDMYFAKVKAS